jgi:dTDP-4-amino-4,6-dideoxygalactose transaminase
MVAIGDLAREHDLWVVEDAAQSIGAALHHRPVGSWGQIGCLSFYPTKNLGGFGDGGMLLTDDDRLSERLQLLRGHGMKPRYVHREIGINSRLDSLQAAVLNVKLSHLAGWTAARQANAARYDALFAAAHMQANFSLPRVILGAHAVWNQYTIRVPFGLRDALRQYLRDQGVGSEIYYPIPLHRQSCYQGLGYGEGSLPHTERAACEVLSLPIFPQLTVAEQEAVVRHTVQFFYSDACRLHDYRSAAA